MTGLLIGEQNKAYLSATALGHAGELLQGAIRKQGQTRRVLVSLPAPSLRTTAQLVLTPGRRLSLRPASAIKARAALHCLLDRLGISAPEIAIHLTSNIPHGKGCGSSTADILAALRALLRYLRIELSESAIAKLIVEVEEAADSTVLSRLAVFRHREGVVEEHLTPALPQFRVLVIDTQPGISVSTTAMQRARYTERQMESFDALIHNLRAGLLRQCPWTVGHVATQSALVNEQFLPKPHFHTVLDCVLRCGGYGLASAHSGTVISALFPDAAGEDTIQPLRCLAKRLGLGLVTGYGPKATRLQSAA